MRYFIIGLGTINIFLLVKENQPNVPTSLSQKHDERKKIKVF